MRKHCANCQEVTSHDREPTSHLLHLIATIIFLPWAVVWVMRYLVKGDVCDVCGTKN
jgi:hypothetical protein